MSTTSRFSLRALESPIVQAPMGGGASTPALAAAVCEAGGLGFLAAGYKAVDAVRADVRELRSRTARPFGVNLFAPPAPTPDPSAVDAYAERIAGHGRLGQPRHDDDGWEEKLVLVADERVPLVSFTFGCPDPGVLAALRDAGAATWVTVTTPDEARLAIQAGADGLLVQGVEAGGHRGTFDDAAPGDVGLLALLQLVRAAVGDVPLVAAGGIATGRAVAAVLAAGAQAAAIGTAFMLADEAATAAVHREALRGHAPTALTRAFTGRTARGIVNAFLREHDGHAPRAYPEVHHLTSPLRGAARERGDPDRLHLWAGQAYPLTREGPAGELVRALSADARAALAEAAARWST
jgi:nitronate monooxygenase